MQERTDSPRRWTAALVALLMAHFVLGVVYSVVTPLWEAPDEWGHYAYINYVATEKRLSPPGDSLDVEFDESEQPPLYYALGGLATFWIDARDWSPPQINPYARTGTGIGGLNFAVHTSEEQFPYHGWVLAAHIARLLSVIIGTVMVWLTYRLARKLSDDTEWLALTAAAIVAFWPQVLFVGSVISNDILAACCGVWVMLAVVKVMQDWPPRFHHLVELGLAIAVALLSKYTALAFLLLLPLVIAVLAIKAIAKREFSPRFWGATGAVLLVILGVGGWWYVRNLLRSGSPILRYEYLVKSLALLWQDPGFLGARLMPTNLLDTLRYVFTTFTASFGWGNVEAAQWVYIFFALLLLAGGVGFAAWLVRRRRVPRLRAWGWPIVAAICILLPATYHVLYKGTIFLRGRIILGVLPPLAIFAALGLGHWLPQAWQRRLPWILGAALLCIAAVIPFLYIAPVYAPPPTLAPDQLKSLSNPLYAQFGDDLELLGYEYGHDGRYSLGEFLEIRTYWRALRAMDTNYTVRWSILDAEGTQRGGAELYPGWGNYATSLWEPGQIVCDTYRILISPQTPSPGIARAAVIVFDAASDTPLPVTSPQGQFLGFQVSLGPFKLAEGAVVRDIATDAEYILADQIALLEYRVERKPVSSAEALVLSLTWQAIAPVPRDYTVFAHLLDEGGEIVSQSDVQPRGGTYPTSFWDVGEVVTDEMVIPLPDGAALQKYTLRLGMYDLDTLEPLPVYDAYGQRISDDAMILPLP